MRKQNVVNFFSLLASSFLAAGLVAGCGSTQGLETTDGSDSLGGSGFSQVGEASWYGPGFQGNRTASGERFNTYAMTAAHRSLPFGTKVCVRNLGNGRTAIVRINDDGPHVAGRIIDLSRAAADAIGMGDIARVRLTKADAANGCDDGQAAKKAAAKLAAVKQICSESLITALTDSENGKVLSVTVSTKCDATKVRPVFTGAESDGIKGREVIFGVVEKGSEFKSVTIALPDEYTGVKVRLLKNETPYTEWKQIELPSVSSTERPVQPDVAPSPMIPPPPITAPPPIEAPPEP